MAGWFFKFKSNVSSRFIQIDPFADDRFMNQIIHHVIAVNPSVQDTTEARRGYNGNPAPVKFETPETGLINFRITIHRGGW
jgi:hypothetical protein